MTNEEYAIQIARDWNVKASGSGYVTRFEVDAEFMAQGQALDDKYGNIGPDDPQADEARREYTELRTAYERFRSESSVLMAQMASDQLESAYRELVDAAIAANAVTGAGGVSRAPVACSHASAGTTASNATPVAP